MEVGDEEFDVSKLLFAIHEMMKNFPKLTAQEILWSYFIPNSQALMEAQEDGRPHTVNEVVVEVLEESGEADATEKVQGVVGIYSLSIMKGEEPYRFHPLSDRPTQALVVANSHKQARSIMARHAGRWSLCNDFRKDCVWENTKKASCSLIATIDIKKVYTSVLYTGKHVPNYDDRSSSQRATIRKQRIRRYS
jgi:hypothetical protein